jgi:hypothetical protein
MLYKQKIYMPDKTASMADIKALPCDATLATDFLSNFAGKGAAKWARALSRCPFTTTTGHSEIGVLIAASEIARGMVSLVANASSRSL